MSAKSRPWFVYMVRCKDGTIYTGISNDVPKRIEAHNQGKGAKYTAGRRPVELIFEEKQTNQSEALRREMEIKKFPRTKKEAL